MTLRFNITVKLLGYLLVAGIVPLTVLGFSALEIAKRVVLQQAQEENVRALGGFASYLSLYQDQIEDLATNIAGNETIGGALRSADVASSSGYDALNVRAQIGYTLNSYVRVKGLVSLDLFSLGGAHFHVGETLRSSAVTPPNSASATETGHRCHVAHPVAWHGEQYQQQFALPPSDQRPAGHTALLATVGPVRRSRCAGHQLDR